MKNSSTCFSDRFRWMTEGVSWVLIVSHVWIAEANVVFTDDKIKAAVDSYLNGDSNYGPIEQWDTYLVTDMNGLFKNAMDFNGDISLWDVSNVTSMSSMFDAASYFNSDISQWDVSNVTDTSYMFHEASSFNVDLTRWNVSDVTNMNYMFYEAISFDQTLCWATDASSSDMFTSSPGNLWNAIECCRTGLPLIPLTRTSSPFTPSPVDIALCIIFGVGFITLLIVIKANKQRNSESRHETALSRTQGAVWNEFECDIREAVILSSVLQKKIGPDSFPSFHTNIEQQNDPEKPNPEGYMNILICPICLENYKEGDNVCMSRNEKCSHVFHLSCIKGWLMTCNSCPMCRTDYLQCHDYGMTHKDP